MALTFSFFFFFVCYFMLNCEQRARISSRLSPNAITAGRGTRGFVRVGEPLCLPCVRRRLERQWGERVCVAP